MRLKNLSFKSVLLPIATAIVLVASAAAQAQSTKTTIPELNYASAQLGDQFINLPGPNGYEEVTQQFEPIKARFAAAVPPQGDLLAGFLPASDVELLRNGKPALFPSWAIINVYREGRTRVSSRAEFARVIGYARQEIKHATSSQSTLAKETLAQLEAALSKEYSKEIRLKLSNPKILQEFNVRPNVYSRLLLLKMGAQADGNELDQPLVLGTMSFVLIKQRIITVLTYKKLESKTDAQTLMKFTTKWLNEIVGANYY